MLKSCSVQSRRAVVKAAGGLAGALAFGLAPRSAKAASRKLILAHNSPPPEMSATQLKWFADQVTLRTQHALQVDFEGGTILTTEIDIANAVKSGNVAMGSPIGAAATLFPEMGVFLVPYLVKSYAEAYRLLNGEVGEQLDRDFQRQYGVKVLFYFDLGFRHVWNNRRPVAEPADLRGMKIRVQPSRVFVDTINGLGGVAVPLPWTEVITAAEQGVIDGGDLPVANMVPLKVYEVSKYFSLTYHNYSPTFLAMNLRLWHSLTDAQQKVLLDTGREAQQRLRSTIESVDSLAGAKHLLEPRGMAVNAADLDAFKKLAEARIWPAYHKQYAELWQKIVTSAS